MLDNLKRIYKASVYSFFIITLCIIILELNESFDIVFTLDISKVLFGITILILVFGLLLRYIVKENEITNMKINNIFNNISSFLVITNGKKLKNVNKSFLRFFNFEKMEDFLEHYSCICDRFEPGEGYLQKKVSEDENWLDHLINNPNSTHKVKMLDKYKNIKIYLVKYQEYYQDDEVHYLVSFDDITQLEQELANNRIKDKQLLEQSRLAQMGEMISMIAHQWRQPLSAISGASTAIQLKAKRDKLTNEVALDLSKKISDYSQHLSSTIDDFRNFFKSNKKKQKTSYKEIIDGVLNIVSESMSNKNINIVKNLEAKDGFESYPNELKQVVLNLIKNAEDVLVSKDKGDKNIYLKSYREDNCCVLEVSDNAGGIPEDIIDKVFDPYFSTKTKKDGTGLGLYMSKTIIEDHCGGKLEVSNNSDGAVFTITLYK